MSENNVYHDERYPFVTFEIEAEQDDIQVRGNAMASGDDAADKAAEDEILERLDQGDIWAWASVKVTAHVTYADHEFAGVDYLGACNYASEADFVKPGGYFDDMKAAAYDDLRNEMKEAVKMGRLAAKALKAV